MSEKIQYTILVLDLEDDFLEWSKKHLSVPGVEIVTEKDPAKAVAYYLENKPDLLICEVQLGTKVTGVDLLKHIRQHDPNAMVILTTGFPSTSVVIESMKIGAYDFLGRESLIYELRPVVENALRDRDEMRATAPETPSSTVNQQETIIGKSPAMQDVFKLIGRVSRSDAPVMITGESGCGKEVVASAIHKFSPRTRNEFVAINCAAIPDNLLESELFGHEKGAFTGAIQRRAGRFEQCDGGTLFLDEIGDMPLQVQSKILRVLQEGELSRVGGNDTIKVDVRILAATNKNLEQEVDNGGFREDLFYRLNVVRIHLPPLRQRREDIPMLADFFLERISKKKSLPRLRLSDEALKTLVKHDWPGNVRELENTIQRACVLATTDVLLPGDLPLGIIPENKNIAYRLGAARPAPVENSGGDTTPESSKTPPLSSGAALSQGSLEDAIEILLKAAEEDPDLKLLPWLEREMTRHAIQRTSYNQAKAAELLGITRATLRKRMEKFGIGKE